MYADNPSGLGAEEIYFDRPNIPPPDDYVPSVGRPRPEGIIPPPSHNRWWDTVDKWEEDGGTGKPPGVRGAQREKIVTNGGKGSWETFQNLPSDNQRPGITLAPAVAATTFYHEDGSVNYYQGERKAQMLNSHVRDYYIKDNRWLMRPEVSTCSNPCG